MTTPGSNVANGTNDLENEEPDIPGIKNIFSEITKQPMFQEMQSALEGASEGELSSLFEGVEQMMSSMVENPQFMNLAQSLTKNLDDQKNQ